MPEIGVIQKPGLFEDLLKRLGVNRPLRPFTLDGNITPVVLVESGVQFIAAPTPAYGVTDFFTTGLQNNPAAATVLADTGPLPVGSYTLINMLFIDSGVLRFDFEWRDAANAANLRTHRLNTSLNSLNIWELRYLVENADERFRISNVVAPGVGVDIQASILAKL